MAKEQKGFEWLGQKELDEKAKRITEGLQWSGQKESALRR